MEKEKDNSKNNAEGKIQLISLTDKSPSSKQGANVGRVPNFVLTTIPKAEPTLFTTEEEKARDEALSKMRAPFDFLDSRRYDYSETQTLLALCYLCSNDEGEDIIAFIDETKKENIPKSRYVTRRIFIKELSRFIFNDRKAVHVNAILKDIISLGAIPIKWIYELKDDQGREQKRMKIAPILNYDIDIPIVDGRKLSMDEIFEKIAEDGYIDVTFGRPFFQRISDRFGYITKGIINDWGSNGTRTVTFVRLSPLLLSMQWQFRLAAIKARGKAIGEAKKDKLPKEQREALIAERERAALTKDFRLSTINDLVKSEEKDGSIKNDFFGNRQYSILKEQVQAVINFYKERDLLLEGYFSGKGKDMKVYFVFNPNFGSSLLPEAEEPDPEEEASNIIP